jgi:hypothetical protein
MSTIRSFNDTMALDRGILDTLNMPAGVNALPENRAFAPPGALRGLVDDNIELTRAGSDPLLGWVIEQPSDPSVLTPSGFQGALGNAVGRLGMAVRDAAANPETQTALKNCARLVVEQLELIKLADINRSALIQG